MMNFVAPLLLRSTAVSPGPPTGDCVRWQQCRHEAARHPQTQTSDINYCVCGRIAICDVANTGLKKCTYSVNDV